MDVYISILKSIWKKRKDLRFYALMVVALKACIRLLSPQEFEKSNHTRFYIGEWHTHPEDYSAPSSRDYKSLKESYHKNKLVVLNLILMAIVGRKAICWKMFDGNAIRDIVI